MFMSIKGACYCGTVTYEVTGPFFRMTHCHCSMCRKHHGAPFATYVSAPIQGFRWLSGEDAQIHYHSSERTSWDSCKVCGSPVPAPVPEEGRVSMPAGPLEGDLGITPQAHIFVGSKAPWYTITDDLPQYEEYPPERGIPGVPHPRPRPREGVVAGSCLCGDVAFEIEGQPMVMQSCHCGRCRRSKGAAHATNVFYKAGQFRWLRGEDKVTVYKLPEAMHSAAAFCQRCAAAMPRVSRERDIAVIAAGALDTDVPMRSQRHIFTKFKAPWFEITDGAPQFAEGPPMR
jgi:hypothetical protein